MPRENARGCCNIGCPWWRHQMETVLTVFSFSTIVFHTLTKLNQTRVSTTAANRVKYYYCQCYHYYHESIWQNVKSIPPLFICTSLISLDAWLPKICIQTISRWRHQMETISPLRALCEGNPPVTGGFPSQRPVTWSFDVFFDLCLKKQLSKPSRRWWIETLSRSLWRHCNE